MIDSIEDFDTQEPEATAEPPRSRGAERQRKILLAVAVLLALLLVGVLAFFAYVSRPLEPVDQPEGSEKWRFSTSITQWGAGPTERLVRPQGIAYTPDGDLVVSDANGGPRILLFSGNSHRPRKVFGTYGTAPGDLGGVWDLAVDEDGSIYAADSKNARVQVFDADGERLREIPARHPQAVFVKDDKLYVGEQGSVSIFTLEGELLQRYGEFGKEAGQFDRISGIWVDDAGTIFVADGPLNRVQALDDKGEVLWVAGKPQEDMNDSDRLFDFAADVVMPADGKLYVLQGLGSRVSVADPATGEVAETLSERGSEDGQMLQPKRFDVAPSGDVIAVTDTFNDRIQIVRIGDVSLLEAITRPRRALAARGWLDARYLCGLPLLLLVLVLVVTFVQRRLAKRKAESYSYSSSS